MRIPPDGTIPKAKLCDYLLTSRPWDDKSKFLAQAGFSKAQPAILEQAIRQLISQNDAVEDGSNEYGTFYRVAGILLGPNGKTLPVLLIWLQWKLDGTFHFVTLKPKKAEQ